MSSEECEQRTSDNRQIDLLELIGGEWPPPARGAGAEQGARGMQRPEPPRLKSSNPLSHVSATHDRRRARLRSEAGRAGPAPPDKLHTGLLVDLSSAGAETDRLREESGGRASPAPASPSVSLEAPDSELADLGIGSLVEVATDLDHQYYGVVRWIGLADDAVYCGVELEHEAPGLTDGSHGGARLFSCAPGRALFVPAALCRRDARFDDPPAQPPHSRTQSFGQTECPAVAGVLAPLAGLRPGACGKNRGIQGHHNSCYLDATLFAMFTFTSVFDSLLYRPAEPQDGLHYTEVQRVLREEIVNPLRQNMFVRADRVMKLRKLLEKLSSISGLTSEEKDPEEFLNSLVAQILRAEPFLKLSSGQEAYYYQLFVEKDHALTLPSVQQLLEQSLQTSGVQLQEAPAVLIVQMPRSGNTYKLYPRILPSQLLDITHLIKDAVQQCAVCGAAARWQCGACARQSTAGLESGAMCSPCLATAHSHAHRQAHKATPLNLPSEFAGAWESCPVPRVYMELFAVLCIETSHYVAFVKAGDGHDAPWCFFDSMADRKGEQDGYNIPEMVLMEEVGAWLSEETSPERQLPPHAKRLLCDAYMCLYRAPDIAMYR